jgi:hypothetical protein
MPPNGIVCYFSTTLFTKSDSEYLSLFVASYPWFPHGGSANVIDFFSLFTYFLKHPFTTFLALKNLTCIIQMRTKN